MPHPADDKLFKTISGCTVVSVQADENHVLHQFQQEKKAD